MAASTRTGNCNVAIEFSARLGDQRLGQPRLLGLQFNRHFVAQLGELFRRNRAGYRHIAIAARFDRQRLALLQLVRVCAACCGLGCAATFSRESAGDTLTTTSLNLTTGSSFTGKSVFLRRDVELLRERLKAVFAKRQSVAAGRDAILAFLRRNHHTFDA